MIDPSDRVCAACGAPLVQRENEARCDWLRRKTCGHACAARAHSKIAAEAREQNQRECRICGAVFVRGPKETATAFNSRETCSRECGNKLRGQSVREAAEAAYAERLIDKAEARARANPGDFPEWVRYHDDPRAVRRGVVFKSLPAPTQMGRSASSIA